MTYHISLFQNASGYNLVTANPCAQRDTYFISSDGNRNPDHNVEINYGDWDCYDEAFPKANFIYTGAYAYCFWDTGKSQIAAIIDQEKSTQLLYSGGAGDLVLTVNPDGTISFSRAI